MKLSYRKWVFFLLSVIALGVGFIVSVNLIVDAYGILRTDFSRQFQEPNQRYVKMKYLLANRNKYDSFLFGSSRALQIDSTKITNGKYYNMGYSEGVPQEHLENIELLLKSGVRIKNIAIALDDFSYRVSPEVHADDLLRQQHYLVSGKKKVDFFSGYFLKMKRFFPSVTKYIRHNYTNKGRIEAKKTFYDFYNSGRVLCMTCDGEINADIKKHISDPKFNKPFHYEGDNQARTLESLQELVSLAKADNIHLTIFINPVHRTTYLDTDLPLFFSFKQKLAGITSYYDFSGLNSVTTNNLDYHETSHFREEVGDMMLRKMFGSPNVRMPDDFGVYVTRGNVDAHIRRQRAEVDAALRDKAPIVKPANAIAK